MANLNETLIALSSFSSSDILAHLKVLKEKNKITNEVLAARIGKHPPQISQTLTGKNSPSLEYLLRIVLAILEIIKERKKTSMEESA